MKTGQSLPCIRHFRGFRLLFLVFSVIAIPCMCSRAQSIDFGTFYGASGQPVAAYLNLGNGIPAGDYSISDGKYVETPVGNFFLPSELNNFNGSGLYSVEVDFSPYSVDGSFSGSGQAVYQNEDPPYDNYTLYYQYSGTNKVPVGQLGLKYQVLSILYTAPGNASSSGFSNTLSAGETDSITNNFTAADTLTFQGGFLGSSEGVSFTTSASHGNTSSTTTSYQATSGDGLFSAQQAIDHNQDQVFLLIDPTITVTQTGDLQGGNAPGYFTVGGSLDSTGTFTQGEPADILNVNIAGLKNPTLIPLEILEPQVVQPGTTLPGLSFICANPLPALQCTQQNACGCTAADFAPIVQQDELANVTDQTIALNNIDPIRFVYVTDEPLQGPDQGGAAAVKVTFALTDSGLTSQGTTNGQSYGVGYSHKWGASTPGDLSISVTNQTTFTYARNTSSGITDGTAHTGTVTLGTNYPQCFEYVDVYEDTIFHTFAYALPVIPPMYCQ